MRIRENSIQQISNQRASAAGVLADGHHPLVDVPTLNAGRYESDTRKLMRSVRRIQNNIGLTLLRQAACRSAERAQATIASQPSPSALPAKSQKGGHNAVSFQVRFFLPAVSLHRPHGVA